jgi:uncharacterized caspase-like protein
MTSFSPERPVFALVIGIDKYKPGEAGEPEAPSDLQCCKRDSCEFYSYLTDVLGVPTQNIRVLHNEQAKRQAILDAFEEHFIQRAEIQKDDAIIFYFAGHGGRAAPPRDWPAEENRVEIICPYDVVRAHGIPDRTLSCLLKKVAYYKGCNIVSVI